MPVTTKWVLYVALSEISVSILLVEDSGITLLLRCEYQYLHFSHKDGIGYVRIKKFRKRILCIEVKIID